MVKYEPYLLLWSNKKALFYITVHQITKPVHDLTTLFTAVMPSCFSKFKHAGICIKEKKKKPQRHGILFAISSISNLFKPCTSDNTYPC